MDTPKRNSSNGLEILIVEDSPTQAEQLKHHLTVHGYAVTVATNGKQALAHALQHKPTLIISDVVMPEMDGYNLCREIKSRATLQHIPVILLTSLSKPQDVIKGLECGADNFIRKPYKERYVLARIDYILTNLELRKTERMQAGVEIQFGAQRYLIAAERQQILDMLISTYEEAVRINEELAAKQQALARERDLLHTLMDNVPDFIYFKDSASRFTRINRAQARTLGVPNPQDAEGRTDFDYFAPEFAQEAYEDEQEILKSGQPLVGKVEEVSRPGGMSIWVSTTKMPMRDDAGQVVGTFGVSRDITQSKRAEAELQKAKEELEMRVAERTAELARTNLQLQVELAERKRAEEEILRLNQGLERRVADRTAQLAAVNKQLEAFSYTVAHDLRAPLRQINGFSNMLAEDYSSQLDPGARRYLELIRDGSQKMGRMVDDLLNLARLERQEMALKVTELGSLVKIALNDLRPDFMGRQVEWTLGNLPTVKCDPGLMQQVFANLLSNAVKYTRPRGQALIQIDQTAIDGQVVIFVRDNGVGFDPSHADKLFGVFRRLHRDEDFEGTGVGLAIVQRIIEKHGGRIWAEAELDKGATFYFTLGEAPIG